APCAPVAPWTPCAPGGPCDPAGPGGPGTVETGPGGPGGPWLASVTASIVISACCTSTPMPGQACSATLMSTRQRSTSRVSQVAIRYFLLGVFDNYSIGFGK